MHEPTQTLCNQKINQGQSSGEKQKRVWSPRALVWFAIFFSVFPAAVLFAINYGRYGQPRKRLIWLVTSGIVLFVFSGLDYFDPAGTRLRLIWLTVLTTWILYAKQIALFRQWRSQGRGVASVWSGLGICLGFVAAYVAVAFALSFAVAFALSFLDPTFSLPD